jgi:hypothetical protein
MVQVCRTVELLNLAESWPKLPTRQSHAETGPPERYDEEFKNEAVRLATTCLAPQCDNGAVNTEQLSKLIDLYQQRFGAIEVALRQLIQQDSILNDQVQRLIQVKGLGLISVSVLIAETNGFERGAPSRLP